jgi:hypothetical protein
MTEAAELDSASRPVSCAPEDAPACPICMEVAVDPVRFTATCKHSGCLECAEQLRGHSWEIRCAGFVGGAGEMLNVEASFVGKCPVCRVAMACSPNPLTLLPTLTHKRRMFVCRFCNTVAGTHATEYAKHLAGCSKKLPVCPNCERALAPVPGQSPSCASECVSACMRLHCTETCTELCCSNCWRTGSYIEVSACERRHTELASIALSLRHIREDINDFASNETDMLTQSIDSLEAAFTDFVSAVTDPLDYDSSDDGDDDNDDAADDASNHQDTARTRFSVPLLRRLETYARSFAAYVTHISAHPIERSGARVPQLIATSAQHNPALSIGWRTQLLIDLAVAYFVTLGNSG